MSPSLSDRSRQLLSQSLPLVQAHKHAVIDNMQASLAPAQSHSDPDPGQSEISAMILVELLINQVRHLVDTGSFDDLDHVPGEHAALNITGRTYSRFGDMLVPILRDVLGPNVPRAVAGAWGDAFWNVIRRAMAKARSTEAA